MCSFGALFQLSLILIDLLSYEKKFGKSQSQLKGKSTLNRHKSQLMMFLKRGNLRQSHDYRRIISKKSRFIIVTLNVVQHFRLPSNVRHLRWIVRCACSILYVLFFLLFLVTFQISLKELFAYLRSAFLVLLLPVTSKPPNWPNSKVSYSHRLRLCVLQYRTIMGWRNIKKRRRKINRTIVSIMCALYGFLCIL